MSVSSKPSGIGRTVAAALIFFLVIFVFKTYGETKNETDPFTDSKKIVALDPMLSQWLLALKRPSGTGNLYLTEVGKSRYLESIFPELGNNLQMTRDINIEVLAAIAPAFIFVKTGSRNEKLCLEKVKTETVSIPFENMEDMLTAASVLGKKLGLEKRAGELASYYRYSLDSLETLLRKSDAFSRPVYVYFAGSTITQTFGKGMFQNYIVELAGGKSVTSEMPGGKIEISIEELLAINPDVIITASYCREKTEDIINDIRLKNLNSIKNRRVFSMPAYLSSWDLPAPESLLGIHWLASKLHPELSIDLSKIIRDFYSTFYLIEIPENILETFIK